MESYFNYIDNVMNIKKEKYGNSFLKIYCLKEKINNLYKLYKDFETIDKIISKKQRTESDIYLLKNILQNDFLICSQNLYTVPIQIKINKLEKEVFDFLDKLEKPYEVIFEDFYFFNTYVYEKGYYPYKCFGVNETALEVASKYAMYKIKTPT
jgi:hypothetical protein